MFTREEFLRAWKILVDKKQIDVRGFNNMHKVLKFLDKEFDLCLYTYINRNDESRQKINDIKIKI